MTKSTVPPPNPDQPPLNISFDVKGLGVRDSSLVFEYTLSNNRDVPLYAFSLLYVSDTSGTPRIDDELVYSRLRDDGILHFSKILLRIPPWAVVEAPDVPLLARVEAGAIYRQVIRVSLPVRCYDPYDDNYPDGYEPVHARTNGWRFSLGVVVDDARNSVIRRAKTAEIVAYYIAYGDGILRQVILDSPLMPEHLEMLAPARVHEQEFLRQIDE